MAKANASGSDDHSGDNDSLLSATPSTGKNTNRSASRSKPYDANNSFVKKLGTKVSDLQRSWIGKFGWFNNSQDERDFQNAENEEHIEDKSSQPPPSKRPCIRMDITHPPGTFDIKPRNRNVINELESSKEQFSNHNETTQDFLEPIASGSNFKPRFVASTPAFPINSNNKIPYSRSSALNLLMSEQNNVATNGTDDNSESGESTSGCSSLVPQNNKQDGQTNANFNSPFANKRRFTDDKMSFTNHLQSPRSLFLDSTSRETLSSRQPSFNPLIATQNSSFEKSSSLLSPFYPGNTMFGGANAANMFRKSKSLLANTSQLNRTAPNRASVKVNPSSNNTTSADVSNMSVTARRILETLEQFSSPLSDAKKIPVRNVMGSSSSSNTSFSSTLGGCRKRTREDECDSPKVGLRHLARELSVPTVPDIMRIRRKQRLQNTTVNARKIMSARNAASAPATQEYSLRTEADNEPKRNTTQYKATKLTNLEEEDSVEPVNLPSLPLPITNLPRFDLPLPVQSAFSSKSSPLSKLTNVNDSFKFASPIRLDGEKNLEYIGNFTFSKPISPSKIISKLNSSESSDMSRTLSLSSNDTLNDSRAPSFPNFMGPESLEKSTSKPQKEELKASKVSPDVKNGSVMEFFKKEAEKKDQSNVWECNDCLIKNNGNVTQCVACKRAKPGEDDNSSDIEIIECPSSPGPKSKKPQKENSLLRTSTQLSDSSPSFFGKISGTQSSTKISTQVEVHSPSPKSSSTSSIFIVKSKSNADLNEPEVNKTPSTFNSESKLSEKSLDTDQKSASPLKSNVPKSSWQCPICMVHNKESASSCPCCNTVKPGSINVSPKRSSESSTSKTSAATTGVGSGFGNMFKKPEGAWTCDTCMIQNKADVSKCLACETPKPGSKPAPAAAPSSFTMPVTSGFGDKFKKPQGSWTCDSCMLSNKSEDTKCVACESPKPGCESSTKSKLQFNVDMPANAGSFKFGIDKADEESVKKATAELPKTNGFSFGSNSSTSSAGGFTFGVPNDAPKTTTGFAFKPSETAAVAATFQFGINTVDKKGDGLKTEQETTQSEKSNVAPGFVFGSSKKVEEEKKENTPVAATFVFGSPTANATSTVHEIEKEAKPSSNFVFGSSKPSFGLPSNDTSTTKAETKSLEATKIVSFSASKSTPSLSFGATAVSTATSTTTLNNTSSSSANPSLFTFGSQKSTTESSSLPTDKPVLSFGSSMNSPSFSNQANQQTQSLLYRTPKSTVSSTDINKSILFGNTSTDNKGTLNSTTFGEPENKIPTFGTSTENKLGGSTFSTPTFGAPTTSANQAPSPFGSIGNTGTNATPTPFGAAPVATGSSSVASSPFGTSAATNANTAPSSFGVGSNMFGNSASSTFGANAATPSIFGSAAKPAETSAPTSGLFSFNQPSQSAASSTGFNFSSGTAASGSNDQKGIFSFGSTSNVQPGNGFGSGFGNTSSSAMPSISQPLTFNNPTTKPVATLTGFGQPADAATGTTPMFNAPASQPVGAPPAYPGTAAPASSGFNFGNTSVPNNFSFGTNSTSGSSGFNFNAPTLSNTSAPVTFDPNAQPTFNFTAGTGAPSAFNAPPSNAGMPVRKIKKAVRRMPRN